MSRISNLTSLKAALMHALEGKKATALVTTDSLENVLTVALWGACPTCGSQKARHPLGPQGKPWVCRDPWHVKRRQLDLKGKK